MVAAHGPGNGITWQPAAHKAKEAFIARFQKGALPDDLTEVDVHLSPDGLLVANLLKEAKLTSSTSESLRMLEQGAVRIDGERVEDRALKFSAPATLVVQVGKRRAAKVRLQ